MIYEPNLFQTHDEHFKTISFHDTAWLPACSSRSVFRLNFWHKSQQIHQEGPTDGR